MKQLLQIIATAAILVIAINSQAQTINWTRLPINTDSTGSTPANLVAVGNTIYFTADDGVHGTELWKTDGTITGTALVRDIYPGTKSSSISNMISFNGTLLFSATDNTTGTSLWKSDGTNLGTEPVRNIFPTYIENTEAIGTYPVVFNNAVYFTAGDANTGNELWKTDGTYAGTVLVKDINPGNTSSTPAYMVVCNDALYFSIVTPTNGSQLWKSDGTAAGTILVNNLLSYPMGVTATSSQVFLFCFNNILVASDGTTAGTSVLKSFSSYADSGRKTFNMMGNNVFFEGYDSTHGFELWKTDGTLAGTAMIKDIYPGAGASRPGMGNGVVIGSNLYFTANDSTHGSELWKTDGTEAGTVLVKDISPGVYTSSITSLCNLNGTLYFAADDGVNGTELWKSDGTTAGTALLANINHGAYGSFPAGITADNNTIFFSATDGSNGMELWKGDGTTVGTALVNDIKPVAKEIGAIAVGNALGMPTRNGFLFTGNDERYGSELFITNGTTNTPTLVKDIFPGSMSSAPSQFVQVQDTTFFIAGDGANITQLWRTDGTTTGTTLIKNINTDLLYTYATALTYTNGSLYFMGFDGKPLNDIQAPSYKQGIWKSDGTTAGTILLKSYAPLTGYEGAFFAAVNGITLFPLSDGLWKTDGTPAGTILVKPLFIDYTTPPVVINNVAYFTATDVNGNNSAQLWRTDGTTAGTTQVTNTFSTVIGSYPTHLFNYKDTLYFQARDANGFELWKSDGTTAGTTVFKGNNCYPYNFIQGPGGMLYFVAMDNTHGSELWKTDGSIAGTVLIKDIYPGISNGNPNYLVNAGNYLFFWAADYTAAGYASLFRTDGTTAGTVTIGHLTGNEGAYPIYVSGNNLYTYSDIGPAPVFGLTPIHQLWTTNISTLLPVQLLSFTAKANGNNAICNWQTTHEINTDHFTVERSTDGTSFTPVGSINAKGNGSSVEQSYTYTDYNAKQLQYTTLYYRLQSVDKDGSSSYSTVAPVTFTDNNTFSISPNPATNKITIHGNNLTSVQIIDNTGKTVITQQVNNTNSLGMDISSLSKGLYFVQMKDSKGNTQTEKLVVE